MSRWSIPGWRSRWFQSLWASCSRFRAASIESKKFFSDCTRTREELTNSKSDSIAACSNRGGAYFQIVVNAEKSGISGVMPLFFRKLIAGTMCGNDAVQTEKTFGNSPFSTIARMVCSEST